jgi:hypothetical protein
MMILSRRGLVGSALPLLAMPRFLRAQQISAGVPAFIPLFHTGVSVGNGADITEDTLQSFTMLAGQLQNVGDALHILAIGTAGATTDSKTAKIKFGATTVAQRVCNAAGLTLWNIDIWITKTGPTAQRVSGNANAQTGTWGIISTAQALADTSALVVSCTGQNATNPVAGSITCDTMIVDYYRAP